MESSCTSLLWPLYYAVSLSRGRLKAQYQKAINGLNGLGQPRSSWSQFEYCANIVAQLGGAEGI